MESMRPGYRTATIALRAPRVVLLFPAFENWRRWARLALRECSRVWGGGGYILVPYDRDGGIDPTLMQVAKAYDPDNVSLLVAPAEVWAETSPGFMARARPDGEAGVIFDEGLAADQGHFHERAGLRAVDKLLEACSIMRMSVSQDWRSGRGSTIGVVKGEAGGLDSAEYLAADMAWEGDAALFASALTGIAEASISDRQAPTEDELLGWLLNPIAEHAPSRLLHSKEPKSSNNRQSCFDAVSPDLQWYRRGFPGDETVLVLGDGASDFALALALQRMRGFALWLTPETITTRFATSISLKSQFGTMILNREKVNAASVSLNETEIAELLVHLDDGALQMSDQTGNAIDTRVSSKIVRGMPPFDEAPLTLLFQEHLGTDVTVPVSESETGTFEFATPLTTPIPSQDAPRLNGISPAWIVDVDFRRGTMPGGRNLPPSAMLAESNESPLSIRATRDGISFGAASMGFGHTSTVLSSRIAKPTLRVPGLQDWVDSMASTGGMTSRLSSAGQKTALLARRLGGRSLLTDLVSGPLHGFLREYVPRAGRRQGSTAVFPDNDGVVLAGNVPMLTFRALKRLTPSMPDDERRDLLDDLLVAGVMRQGLVLGCADCHEGFFISLEDLGQRYTCPRCGAANALTADRWKRSTEEPEWYYDLHGAFRKLLKEDGDAVLLTAAHLRRNAHYYSDASELSFFRVDADTRNPEYEIDLIAHTQNGLLVCEVKTNANLRTGEERTQAIVKRFEAARLLRADRVIFASVGPPWGEGETTAVETLQKDDYQEIPLEMLSIPRPS